MSENPLARLGDLTKPAETLIEKISDAVGGVFKPYQIVRVAKAEAEAERIRARAEIQITGLHRRAMHRFLEEEAKKQSNIESITGRALPLLCDKSTPEKVENDWISNFFDKCRIVSDADMQQLWSKILAGEANTPGSFSRKTINLVGDLEKSDAELLTRLCGFGWVMGRVVIPLVYNDLDEIYQRQGVTFNSLIHLESLGLVKFNKLGGYKRVELPKRFSVFYYGRSVELTLPKDADNELNVGTVLLSRAGEELAPVCGARPVEGFFDYVYDQWTASSLVPKREVGVKPEQGTPGIDK